MANIALVYAVANNGVIGLNNRLPWKQRDDLKRFRSLTEYHTVVMGRRTFESLQCIPLPNRFNIVVTTKPTLSSHRNLVFVSTPEAAILPYKENQKIFVIGGVSLFQTFYPLANEIYETRIIASPKGDTLLRLTPESDPNWILSHIEYHQNDEENQYPYAFKIFLKTRP